MSETGRYYITDEKTGRKFCIEPIHADNERATAKTFRNGGIGGNAEKNKSQIKGGSISEEESIMGDEKRFKDVVDIGPFMSPEAFIEDVCRKGIKLTENLPLKPPKEFVDYKKWD